MTEERLREGVEEATDEDETKVPACEGGSAGSLLRRAKSVPCRRL